MHRFSSLLLLCVIACTAPSNDSLSGDAAFLVDAKAIDASRNIIDARHSIDAATDTELPVNCVEYRRTYTETDGALIASSEFIALVDVGGTSANVTISSCLKNTPSTSCPDGSSCMNYPIPRARCSRFDGASFVPDGRAYVDCGYLFTRIIGGVTTTQDGRYENVRVIKHASP